ncbi:hypothetical protein BDZ89DRAFT_990143 [Hymenopellis radicata]|nr:hypothetical protein BDZ89DRAFT_990143 [Hymenopellis radicata]
MELKQIELARETRGHYIGPMPVQTFLDDFLPWNEETPKEFRDAKIPTRRLNVLKSVAVASETNSYKQYINAFSGWPKAAANAVAKTTGTKPASYIKSAFTFKDTHSHRDTSCGGLGMDISLYGGLRVQRNKPRVMDFHNSEGFVEMKPDENSDAFVDPPEPTVEESNEEVATEDEDDDESDELPEADDDDDAIGKVDEALYVAQVDGKQENTEVTPGPEPHQSAESTPPIMTTRYPFENGSRLGMKTRGQLAAYNAVTLAVQYRSHLFSTLVCGTYARLMRWDRSCAIVSRRFDYTTVKGAEMLFRFYQRFAQLTREQRGLDPSITIPTKVEGEAAKAKFRDYVSELWIGQTQSYFKEQEAAGYLSLLKMVFNGETYIIAAPVYHEGFLSPFCRSTRRCLAFRPRDDNTFFFKDYWRENSAITLKESEIYERLALHKIENVAKMEAGGDVDNLKTIGHLYAYEDWVSRATPLAIRQLYGHRILLVDIGRDLLTFDTAKGLVKCVADAMKAHQMAYEKAGILHRDISVGNILMKLRGGDMSKPVEGFLIDWDHCVVLDLIPTDGLHKHRISRTGTWQFISAHLAENPGADHTVLDDRESAFYVLVYVALRHLRHNMDPQDLSGLLRVFDDYVVQAGRPDKGGASKKHALTGFRFAEVEYKVPVMSERGSKVAA